MKVLVTGGGTGGHIYPAIALIQAIREQDPSASFLYVGTENGLENTIVPKHDIPFKTIEISGFKRKLSFENVKTVQRFLKGTADAKKMIRDFQPDVALGTGGYVAGPVIYAAAKSGVPSIIHEQNSIPGLTNKFLSRYAKHVAVSFEEAKAYFPKGKSVFTGNPRASEVVHAEKINVKKEFGFQDHLPVVMIVGGSRGAKPIHDAFLEALPQLSDKQCQYLYITGSVHYDKVKERISEVGVPHDHVVVRPFIHNMPNVLASIDAIVSRAGATTLAEITALGIPSILIPSPYVTKNHQEMNARTLEKVGAAVVHKESEWSGAKLQADIENIFQNGKESEMKKAAHSMAVPDAAERLYELMKSTALK
ncbi:UDP-N-acetylglucosamine--N-acetylmuramyl-(pentapeptide) pyrophosphoryl-undecaprenol N-acetylglucosamine transferase [Geomicrobium halophilum]|uniref:UDP-N-acetylglucosamine--N-acetylmuramyl-(pentapeptide) pyrophosphoryl-undecaprenol N-acetylglucosamine transferase n=1 Tax=Geomicrobium halophilum TaxID=549000 RepID=A0A841PNM9_9BACL|nr:undecaprenyldiphospho-muramoylpentapeptide beta-N-acetylglucosaminyltransferase [Geomicrobium halophilum]MBB6449384.1 UDP-N-acetylglucosamine--N-acetylmuramyl-(pentapeptide) pyrophosphoryl-undecaprenol N-acetylglucosamine transferase [Geomicrobium halophilum]